MYAALPLGSISIHIFQLLDLFSLCIFSISDWKQQIIGLSPPRSETIAFLAVSFSYGASDLWLLSCPLLRCATERMRAEKSSISAKIRRFNLQRCLEWAVADAAQPQSSAGQEFFFLGQGVSDDREMGDSSQSHDLAESTNRGCRTEPPERTLIPGKHKAKI